MIQLILCSLYIFTTLAAAGLSAGSLFWTQLKYLNYWRDCKIVQIFIVHRE